MRSGVTLLLLLVPLLGQGAPTAEFNPFFARRAPQVSVVLQRVKGQIAQGCTAALAGKRPIAERYDLRHQLPQPQDPILGRAAAAVSLADPDYPVAREWLLASLDSPSPELAFHAHTVLLAHGARRLMLESDRVAALMADDLKRSEVLAMESGANPADLHFWQALLARHDGGRDRALVFLEQAIAADPYFYNARLLRLELLLDAGRSASSTQSCRPHAATILQAAVDLFDLDTCPRHAVLLLNWLRARPGDLSTDSFGQLVSAYVTVLLGNPAAYMVVATAVQDRQDLPCRGPVLSEIRELGRLLEQP